MYLLLALSTITLSLMSAQTPITHRWHSYLSPDSQILAAQFSEFINTYNIEAAHTQVPDEFVRAISSTFQISCNPVTRTAHHDKILQPTFVQLLLDKNIDPYLMQMATEQSLALYIFLKGMGSALYQDNCVTEIKNFIIQRISASESTSKTPEDTGQISTVITQCLEQKNKSSMTDSDLLELSTEIYYQLTELQSKEQNKARDQQESSETRNKARKMCNWLNNFCYPYMYGLHKNVGLIYAPIPHNLARLLPSLGSEKITMTSHLVAQPNAAVFSFVLSINENALPCKQTLDTLSRRITTCVNMPFFIQHFDNKNQCAQPLGEVLPIYLYQSMAKKLMPQGPLGPLQKIGWESINSAETAPCDKILILRAEEAHKLILHELMHLMKTDTRSSDPKLKELFALEGGAGLYEAVVESMACILNTVFTALEYCQEHTACPTETLEKMWHLERLFGIFQAAKLLNAYGFNTVDEFYNPSTTTTRVYQSTAAAEYHILKAIILQDPATFIEIMTAKNPEGYDSAAIIDLIYANKDKIAPVIDQMLAVLRTHGNQLPSELAQTLRMTIIERELA